MDRQNQGSRWLVDIDGTIADTPSGAIAQVNKMYGTHYTVGDIDRYDWLDQFNLPQGAIFTMEVYRDACSLPGASTFLWRLARAGCHIHLVTARPWASRAATLAWLHRECIPWDAIDFDYTPRMKANLAVTASYIVEDDPRVLELCTTTPYLTRILMARPWNAKTSPGSVEHIVHAWWQVWEIWDSLGKTMEVPIYIQEWWETWLLCHLRVLL